MQYSFTDWLRIVWNIERCIRRRGGCDCNHHCLRKNQGPFQLSTQCTTMHLVDSRKSNLVKVSNCDSCAPDEPLHAKQLGTRSDIQYLYLFGCDWQLLPARAVPRSLSSSLHFLPCTGYPVPSDEDPSSAVDWLRRRVIRFPNVVMGLKDGIARRLTQDPLNTLLVGVSGTSDYVCHTCTEPIWLLRLVRG